MKRKVLVVFVIVVMLISLTGCSPAEKKKEAPTPYAIKENLEMITDENISLDIPAYFYTKYIATGSLDIDGVEMISKTLKYTIVNLKREKQESCDVITFDCDISGNMEFKFSNISGEWTYSFIYSPFNVFDYNTGDIIKKKQVGVENTVNLFDDKLNKEKNDEEIKYTKINWNDNELEIGVLESLYNRNHLLYILFLFHLLDQLISLLSFLLPLIYQILHLIHYSLFLASKYCTL